MAEMHPIEVSMNSLQTQRMAKYVADCVMASLSCMFEEIQLTQVVSCTADRGRRGSQGCSDFGQALQEKTARCKERVGNEAKRRIEIRG